MIKKNRGGKRPGAGPKPKMAESEMVSFRVPKDWKEKMGQFAKSQGVKPAAVYRQAFRDLLLLQGFDGLSDSPE